MNITDIFGDGVHTKNYRLDDVSVIDAEWVSSRFMTPSKDMEENLAKYRFNSTATMKFTDTSLGNNLGVNVRPQFTRYCDIRSKSRIKSETVTINSTTGNYGMGRYYSESIDDNQQLIYLTFGVPKFNGLVSFFTRAIDYEDSIIANTGRSPLGYSAGKAVGNLAVLVAFPMMTMSIWLAKSISKLLVGHENFSYYYLDTQMPMYWGTVNLIVTNLATELGILLPELLTETKPGVLGLPVKLNKDDMSEISKLLNNGLLDKDTNYIDVFAIATKAQRVANRQMLFEYEYYQKLKESEEIPSDFQVFLNNNNNMSSEFWNTCNKYVSFQTWLDKLFNENKFYNNSGIKEDTPKSEKPETVENIDLATTKPMLQKNADGYYPIKPTQSESYLESLAGAIDAGIRDGGHYAIFAVDYTGSASESFSNSIGEISSGEMLKQVGGKARDLSFNLAGGNVTEFAGTVLNYTKDVIAGALDSVSFGLSSVLATITGGGYIDLPKKWEDSDSNFPEITYTMQLISPYGNIMSQMQNIYIPLCMLLAGTLPLATGKASYTSPYLCSLYSKGIQKIKLGMITSLSITRGTSNLGFNKQRRPLEIDVSFIVKDFSSLVAAPINNSIFGNFTASLDDDTPLSHYLATLASRDLLTDKYYLSRIKMKASRILMNFEQAISPASIGLRVGEKLSFVLGGLAAEHSLALQSNR